MNYFEKMLIGMKWQFRRKSISRVGREIINDMREMAVTFCRCAVGVILAPVAFVLAAPARILVWMLSPFISPLLKVSTEVWASLQSKLPK